MTERERRAIWIAVVVIPSVVGLRLLGLIAAEWNAETRRRADAEMQAISMSRAMIASESRRAAILDSLRVGVDSYLQSVQVMAIDRARGEFLRIVSQHAESSDFDIESTDLLPSRQLPANFFVLSVRIQGAGSGPSLETFLRRIASDSHGIRMRALSVVQTGPLISAAGEEVLRVGATLTQLVRAPTPSETR